MTARDKWGYTSIYKDGSRAEENNPGKGYLVHYYYSENDGWSFMRGSVDREMHISFGKGVKPKDLEALVKDKSINKDARDIMRRMMKQGKLKPGAYPVD